MKVIAVIPAYNEGKMVAEVVKSVIPYLDEVIVVNDGSKDATAEMAKSADALVYSHPINRGQGAALRTGMRAAIQRGADIIIHFDSDGQHPAHQIPDIVGPIEKGEADVVMGSRFLDNTTNMPKGRRLVLRLGALFTRIMTGLNITDPHSGFRAMTADTAKKLKLRQDKMAHASEILQLIARHKLRYKEVPITVRYTQYSMNRPHAQASFGAIRIVVDLFKGLLF